MRFDDLNWMDVEHYLAHHDNRVVVITGACEQHAYLSLLSDVRAPLAIAQAAAGFESVLIAPPLPYGISPYFAAYPGTVSLTPATFTAVVREVLTALVKQGFAGVLVSNGHGGNTDALRYLLIELGAEHPGVTFDLFEWWRDERVLNVATAAGLPPNHANWLEALPANRVADLPDGDKAPPQFSRVAPPEAVREALGDGSFGGPYHAPDAVMDRVFEAAVTSMVERLRALAPDAEEGAAPASPPS